MDGEDSQNSRFWLNASRAAEDEKAVREFLRGEGRGIDGAAFRAFVRDCRRKVGPDPVFEPARKMLLNGVRYEWGVWFRPRPSGDPAAETETVIDRAQLDQPSGMAIPDRPPVDTVTSRDDDAYAGDEAGTPASRSTDVVTRPSTMQSSMRSSMQSVAAPSPISPSRASGAREDRTTSTSPARRGR